MIVSFDQFYRQRVLDAILTFRLETDDRRRNRGRSEWLWRLLNYDGFDCFLYRHKVPRGEGEIEKMMLQRPFEDAVEPWATSSDDVVCLEWRGVAANGGDLQESAIWVDEVIENVSQIAALGT